MKCRIILQNAEIFANKKYETSAIAVKRKHRQPYFRCVQLVPTSPSSTGLGQGFFSTGLPAVVIITCVVPSQHLETRRLFSTSLTLVSLTEVATWRLEAHYGLALLSASSVSGTGPWNPRFCGRFWGRVFWSPWTSKLINAGS